MTYTPITFTPGEHSLSLKGAFGSLEAKLTVPEAMDSRTVAILGHPHSLFGGTMQNKVVTTMARAFEACHIASLRFNFRGVGLSEGVYDAGIGESQDMRVLADLVREAIPAVDIIFAGFSFGAYVAFRAARTSPHKLLLSIAPPVQHFEHKVFSNPPEPWVIVQPLLDEVVPASLVFDYVSKSPSQIKYIPIDAAGHFFHGQLPALKAVLMNILCDL